MGRKKIAMNYIATPQERRASYVKRCAGLQSKAKQLSILTRSRVLLVIQPEPGYIGTNGCLFVEFSSHDGVLDDYLVARAQGQVESRGFDDVDAEPSMRHARLLQVQEQQEEEDEEEEEEEPQVSTSTAQHSARQQATLNAAVPWPTGSLSTPTSPLLASLPASHPNSLPASLPTILPTILPASLPASLPTDLQTSLPTSLPTNLQTSLPTNLQTSLPTTSHIDPMVLGTYSPVLSASPFPATTPLFPSLVTHDPTMFPAPMYYRKSSPFDFAPMSPVYISDFMDPNNTMHL